MQSVFLLTTIVNQILKPMPLVSVDYSGVIENGAARITMTQRYSNPYENPIDVSFNCPLLSNIVFDNFTATFGETTVYGKVQKKEEARQVFEQAVYNGQQAALASSSSSTSDIMNIEIGNIKPYEDVTLSLTFFAPLESVYDGNLEFKIPATLTPRYRPESQPADSESMDPLFTSEKAYPWTIDLTIHWDRNIKVVSSPSHEQDSVIKIVDQNTVRVSLSPLKTHYPDKDFRIVIQDNEQFEQVTSVAKSDTESALPHYAAMLQFVPDMNAHISDDDLKMQKLSATQAEFVFILDRSGSMMGSRIEQAKTSLIYFLKSLPTKSYFSIISFGSTFEAQNSLPYSDEAIQTVIDRVAVMDADLGGTEILEPLQYALSSKRIPNYQRNIFLLTDGSVSNSDQIVELIKSSSASNQARVFSIGIGNGCSEVFIRGSAEAGRGKSLLISDNEEDVQGKIVDLLLESLSPSLTSFEIDFDKRVVKGIAPLLNESSHILRNEPFRIYVLLDDSVRNENTDITVSYYDSVEEARKKITFTVSGAQAKQSDTFHKMLLAKIFAGQPHYLADESSEIASSDYLANLSVEYQVWSPKYSSFVCVSRDTEIRRDNVEKVIVPTIQSVDYNSFGGFGMYGMVSAAYVGNASPMMAGAAPMAAPMMRMAAPVAAPMMKMAQTTGERSYGTRGAMVESAQPEADIAVASFEMAADESNDRVADAFFSDSASADLPTYDIPTPQSNDLYLMKLVSVNGSWKFSEDLLQNLKVAQSLEELKQLLGSDDSTVIATLVSCAYLKKFHGSSPSVQIVLAKSKAFLKTSGVEWAKVDEAQQLLFN